MSKYLLGGLAGATALVALSATTASAASVSYTTTGSFTSSDAGLSEDQPALTFGGITLSFDGTAGSGDPTFFADLGSFQTDGSMGDNAGNQFDGQSFYLFIEQTAPGSTETGSSVGSIAGTISYSSGVLSITFVPDPVVIESFMGSTTYTTTYSLSPNPLNVNVPSAGQEQRLGAMVTQVVPTPSAALGGLGLLGLAATGRVRRRLLGA